MPGPLTRSLVPRRRGLSPAAPRGRDTLERDLRRSLLNASIVGRTSERGALMPAKKEFRIPGDKIVPVAPGRGSCIASDMILVDGHPVGYMYREAPHLEHDSGWRFFSGLESQDYADDADHFAYYDVNTVANCDRSIVPCLGAPVGSAFERAAGDQFVAVPFPEDPDSG